MKSGFAKELELQAKGGYPPFSALRGQETKKRTTHAELKDIEHTILIAPTLGQ